MVSCGFFTKITIKKTISLGLKETICFFLQYAAISMFFTVLWGEYNFWLGLPIAIGIFMYGLAYFIVHDVFIHQRFKILRNIDNKYARGLRRAHKIHHKHLGKKDGECFGMLVVPKKYFK